MTLKEFLDREVDYLRAECLRGDSVCRAHNQQRLQQAEAWQWEYEVLRAQRDVLDGTTCTKMKAEGRDACGICVRCLRSAAR